MNNNKNKFIVGTLILAGAFVGCSGASTTAGTGSSNSQTSAFTAVYEGLKEALPATTSQASVNRKLSQKSDLSTLAHSNFNSSIWPSNENSPYTGSEYVLSLVADDNDRSVIGRTQTALMIACFLDTYGDKDANGKLTVGTQNIKMTTAWAQSSCPNASIVMPQLFEQATQANLLDENGDIPLTMVVSDIESSSGGIYERKIEMPGSSNPQFGGNDQIMRLKIEGSNVTFSHDEWQGNRSSSAYTSFIKYTDTPRQIIYQNTSGSTMKELYRFYTDETSDKAALLAFSYDSGGSQTEVLTVLTAKPSDLSVGTLSQVFLNLTGNVDGDGNGCFNFDSGVLDADGFGSCGSNLTGLNASSASSVITTFKTNPDDALTDTTIWEFNESNILTTNAFAGEAE